MLKSRFNCVAHTTGSSLWFYQSLENSVRCSLTKVLQSIHTEMLVTPFDMESLQQLANTIYINGLFE